MSSAPRVSAGSVSRVAATAATAATRSTTVASRPRRFTAGAPTSEATGRPRGGAPEGKSSSRLDLGQHRTSVTGQGQAGGRERRPGTAGFRCATLRLNPATPHSRASRSTVASSAVPPRGPWDAGTTGSARFGTSRPRSHGWRLRGKRRDHAPPIGSATSWHEPKSPWSALARQVASNVRVAQRPFFRSGRARIAAVGATVASPWSIDPGHRRGRQSAPRRGGGEARPGAAFPRHR